MYSLLVKFAPIALLKISKMHVSSAASLPKQLIKLTRWNTRISSLESGNYLLAKLNNKYYIFLIWDYISLYDIISEEIFVLERACACLKVNNTLFLFVQFTLSRVAVYRVTRRWNQVHSINFRDKHTHHFKSFRYFANINVCDGFLFRRERRLKRDVNSRSISITDNVHVDRRKCRTCPIGEHGNYGGNIAKERVTYQSPSTIRINGRSRSVNHAVSIARQN